MIKTRPLPTQERLRYLFYYNPKTGKLYARFKGPGKAPIGRHGSLSKQLGYYYTRVDGVRFLNHRLIWVYVNGDIPEGKYIDHMDGDRTNNKIDNLRLVSKQENDHNKTNAKGFHFSKAAGKYQAQIMVDGKHKYLGLYDTPKEARAAYLKAKDQLHPTHKINL